MKSSLLRTPMLCLSLLTLAACGQGKTQGPPQMPPPAVGVITAQPQSSPLTQNLVGRLSPYRSADVRARVPGVLFKRNYDEGTDVKKGQLLFQIDPAPLKAALDSSMAAQAQAQAPANLSGERIFAQAIGPAEMDDRPGILTGKWTIRLSVPEYKQAFGQRAMRGNEFFLLNGRRVQHAQPLVLVRQAGKVMQNSLVDPQGT